MTKESHNHDVITLNDDQESNKKFISNSIQNSVSTSTKANNKEHKYSKQKQQQQNQNNHMNKYMTYFEQLIEKNIRESQILRDSNDATNNNDDFAPHNTIIPKVDEKGTFSKKLIHLYSK